MKILTADQIRKADQFTIENEPISSIELMERAALEFTDWFCRRFDSSHRIRMICGTGNNGGDGLAIARLLSERGYDVMAAQVRTSDQMSEDCGKNFERLEAIQSVKLIRSEEDIPEFHARDLVIDALFGSGLSRPVEGLYARVIHAMNASLAKKVAVDIPSGLYCDKSSSQNEAIVNASDTATFQCPKLAFFMPENGRFVGQWDTLDIGLSKKFLDETETPFHTIEKRAVRKLLKSRSKFDHKGTFGKALLIAGSKGKMGAAVLAARACLHSGIGLLTTHIPASAYVIMQTAVPEAMASLDGHEAHFSSIPSIDPYDAIGVGPGLGKHEHSVQAVKELLKIAKVPLVLDADALNILSNHPEWYADLPENSILTPHPKEFERLYGDWGNDFERLEKQRQFARKHKVYVVLKGGHTAIATPEGNVCFNMTGNPGMATGGTGDVLTGILTSLVAQNYTAEDAAIIGVFLHGTAGDLAAGARSQMAMLASDLIEYIGQAVLSLEKRRVTKE